MAERFRDVEVDLAKLRDYCLSETHPRGRHKARLFRSRLGLTSEHAEMLRRALLDAVRGRGLRHAGDDRYGRRYALEFDMTTASGKATIRSVWIVLAGQDVLRLVTCFVLR
jgi:hypothetical protein